MRGDRERRRQRILFPRHAQHRSLSVFIEMPLFPLRRDWVNICFLQAIDGPRGRRIKTDINCYRQCIPNNTCIFLVQAFSTKKTLLECMTSDCMGGWQTCKDLFLPTSQTHPHSSRAVTAFILPVHKIFLIKKGCWAKSLQKSFGSNATPMPKLERVQGHGQFAVMNRKNTLPSYQARSS